MEKAFGEHGKQLEPVYFSTQLNWIGNKKGILRAGDAKGIIHVAPPAQFGGEGQEWSPEEMFLGSISSCFMTTFLFLARKHELAVSHFECTAHGQVELVKGKYEFTEVEMYPRVHIMDESLRCKAEQLLVKTNQYCLIAGSLKCRIVYHTEILVGFQPRLKNSKKVNG